METPRLFGLFLLHGADILIDVPGEYEDHEQKFMCFAALVIRGKLMTEEYEVT